MIGKDELFYGPNGMVLFPDYFSRMAESDPDCEPQLQASKNINDWIASTDVLNFNEVEQAIAAVKHVDSVAYAGGSGWMDYKMRLSGLLHRNGFSINWSDGSLKLLK